MSVKLVYDEKSARFESWERHVDEFAKMKERPIKPDPSLPLYSKAQVVNLSHAFLDRLSYLFLCARKLASANQSSGAYLRRMQLPTADLDLLERLTDKSRSDVQMSALFEFMARPLANLEVTLHGPKLLPTDLCLLGGVAVGKMALNMDRFSNRDLLELLRLATLDLSDLTVSMDYFSARNARVYLAARFDVSPVDYRFDFGQSVDQYLQSVVNNTELMCHLSRQTYFGTDESYLVPPSKALDVLVVASDPDRDPTQRLAALRSYKKPPSQNEGYMRFFDLCVEIFLDPHEDLKLREFAQQFMLDVTGVATQLRSNAKTDKVMS